MSRDRVLAPHSPSSSSLSTDQVLETPPSPARIAAAIAAFPYSPKVAILDILDNSVEAGAEAVSVEFEQEGKNLRSIRVIDNGTGVQPEILDEVLRAGSKTSHLYNPQSLARYGIGLKGAGFALGRKVTLLTRSQGLGLRRRAIDLDHIEAMDAWLQETRKPTSQEAASFEAALNTLPGSEPRETGTVVLIENLNIRSRDIIRIKTDVVRGAGEAYGKFLGITGGVAKLQVLVDGTSVEPIDPLHREHPDTVVLVKREQIELDGEASLFVTAVAMPHPNKVSDEVRRKHRYTQKDQGIYIYRNGRLVMGGETLDLFQKDFHLNAFRAELEYTTPADAHITVDVAKSAVVLSPEAISRIQPLVVTATSTANTLWREKDILTEDDIKGLFDESNRLIGSRSKLLVQDLRKRKANLPRSKKPAPKVDAPTPEPVPQKRRDGLFLRPISGLPGDVLYRPVLDGQVGGLVVEVNLAHPFSKAVFEVSGGEGKKGVPRRATTAVQQLLYLLGYCEDGLSEDADNRELFEQFRRYLSMNLRALLAD